MEKQDILYFVVAIVIVAVMALVVKPVLSGEEVQILPSFAKETPTETPTATITPIWTPDMSSVSTRPPTTVPTPTPTPAWDGTTKSVSFVDPDTYKIDLTEPILNGTPRANTTINRSLTTYAKISGKWSGTTEIVHIPFPYWELYYTAEPAVDTSDEDVFVFPRINIQVMDAEDPNRFVRICNPDVLDMRTFEEHDPRPWVEKFYEGNRNYYFVINTRFVSSYTLEIKVPALYTET
jgi:hypothetical protein